MSARKYARYLLLMFCGFVACTLLTMVYKDFKSPKPFIPGDVFRIVSSNKIAGTAWVVEFKKKRFMVTAAHFCTKVPIAETFVLNDETSMSVLSIDKVNDICILKLSNSNKLKPFIIEDNYEELAVGEPMEYMGFPNQAPVRIAGFLVGIYSSMEKIGPMLINLDCEIYGGFFHNRDCLVMQNFLLTTMLTDFGASGSPVYNKRGIVGILVSMNKYNKFAIVIPVNKIILNLKKVTNDE